MSLWIKNVQKKIQMIDDKFLNKRSIILYTLIVLVGIRGLRVFNNITEIVFLIVCCTAVYYLMETFLFKKVKSVRYFESLVVYHILSWRPFRKCLYFLIYIEYATRKRGVLALIPLYSYLILCVVLSTKYPDPITTTQIILAILVFLSSSVFAFYRRIRTVLINYKNLSRDTKILDEITINYARIDHLLEEKAHDFGVTISNLYQKLSKPPFFIEQSILSREDYFAIPIRTRILARYKIKDNVKISSWILSLFGVFCICLLYIIECIVPLILLTTIQSFLILEYSIDHQETLEKLEIEIQSRLKWVPEVLEPFANFFLQKATLLLKKCNIASEIPSIQQLKSKIHVDTIIKDI